MPNTADLIKKNHYDTKVADIENKIPKTTELVKQIVTRKIELLKRKHQAIKQSVQFINSFSRF